jgi:hypothetical protein
MHDKIWKELQFLMSLEKAFHLWVPEYWSFLFNCSVFSLGIVKSLFLRALRLRMYIRTSSAVKLYSLVLMVEWKRLLSKFIDSIWEFEVVPISGSFYVYDSEYFV